MTKNDPYQEKSKDQGIKNIKGDKTLTANRNDKMQRVQIPDNNRRTKI